VSFFDFQPKSGAVSNTFAAVSHFIQTGRRIAEGLLNGHFVEVQLQLHLSGRSYFAGLLK
jgi:hypothetical protein